MERMTELKEFRMYRPGGEVPAVRLTDYPGERSIVVVHEESDKFELKIAPVVDHIYLVGPIVDRLFEYEWLDVTTVDEQAKRIEELARDLNDAEERNNVKAQKIDELRGENEELAKQINHKDSKILNLMREKHNEEELRDRLYADIALLLERNDTLAKRIDELQGMVNTRDDEISALRNTINGQEGVIRHMCSDRALVKENTELKKTINELQEQNEKYDLVIHTIEQLFGCAFDI